jgi:hypothetical protein
VRGYCRDGCEENKEEDYKRKHMLREEPSGLEDKTDSEERVRGIEKETDADGRGRWIKKNSGGGKSEMDRKRKLCSGKHERD